MKVLKIDDSTVTISYIVWIAKSDDEDWPDLPDDSYSHERFKPNRVCVVVRQSRGRTWADWAQARYHHEDRSKSPEMEDCRGTYEIPTHDSSEWVRKVEDLAVSTVKEAS